MVTMAIFRDQRTFKLWHIGHVSPTLVALGTSLVEDNFFKDSGGGVWFWMIQVHYIYCATVLLTGSRAEGEFRQ